VLNEATTWARCEDQPIASIMTSAIGVSSDVAFVDALRRATQAKVDEVVVLAVDGTPTGHFSVAMADRVPLNLR
jgi:diacylglycerol kinase family enzyme